MTNEMMIKSLKQVAADVAALIDENTKAICEAIKRQMIAKAAEDEYAKLEFSLSIGAKITPRGDEADVMTSIAWAVKEKKIMDSTVSDQQVLPLEG